ncbi:MAG: hypothetical protein IJD01_00275 [Clostridia bacterium]|nr:hypothetical protein [Clostridia bacterium]
MSNVSVEGLLERLWDRGVLFLLIGVVLLLVSRFWNTEKRSWKLLLAAGALIVYSLANIVFYAYKASNPTIESCVAPYSRQYSPKGATDIEFVFGNKSYYLDSTLTKEVFPEELIVGKNYRIYYDKETKVILAVEIPQADELPLLGGSSN